MRTVTCSVFSVAALLAAEIFFSPNAHADNWYKGGFCAPEVGCLLNKCELSDVSPAQIYERNQVFGGAQIVDGDNGRVDVIAQGAKLIFFRTVEACRTFVAQQSQTIQNQQQQQQKMLNNYR